MTLTRFVTKNAFRNKRRSVLTVLSIGGSLLLLTFLITIWRSFYDSKPSEQSAQRLIVRHKVSLVFNLPSYYKQKIQAIPGVKEVVNQQWFGGQYKDDKPENFFAQFGTDPQEIMKVYPEFKIPADQLEAWQHDRAGAIVDVDLAKKFGWKVGDRMNITGTIFPLNLELTIRGIFTPPDPTQSIYFNKDYMDEGFPKLKGHEGFYAVLADSPQNVPKVAQPLTTCSAMPQAHQDGERARLPAGVHRDAGQREGLHHEHLPGGGVHHPAGVGQHHGDVDSRAHSGSRGAEDFGLHPQSILGLFVGEAVSLAVVGGLVGSVLCVFIVSAMASQGGMFTGMKVTPVTMLAALLIAAGWDSPVPSYLPTMRPRSTSWTACVTSAEPNRNSVEGRKKNGHSSQL